MSRFMVVALKADKIGLKVQELQIKYEELLKQYNISWIPNYFGEDITELSKKRIEDHFIITPEDKNNFIHWEIRYDEREGFLFYKYGVLDFRWITCKIPDEKVEMKRILSQELEQLIEDREIVDVKNRSIIPLDDRDIEELKRVINKLKS